MKLSKGNLALCIIGTLDLVSTIILLVTGRMVEANPVMAYFLRFGLTGFILVKLLSYVPACYVLEWYRSKNLAFSSRMTRIVVLGYIGIYGFAIIGVNR